MPSRTACMLVALLMSIAASSSVGDDKKSKKTGIEGTWVAVKKDSPAQQLKFTGNKFEAKIGKETYKGTFKLNNDETPLQIDMKITSSTVDKHKGKTALGIYDFQGANLRWCSSQPGRKRRPSEFAKVMGDARLMLGVFKPQKTKK